jgi:hypothetical protein
MPEAQHHPQRPGSHPVDEFLNAFLLWQCLALNQMLTPMLHDIRHSPRPWEAALLPGFFLFGSTPTRWRRSISRRVFFRL